MKRGLIIIGIVAITALIALIVIIDTVKGGSGETCQCMLVGDCVYEDGVGYKWRQCYGSCYVYSHWYKDNRCGRE